MACIASLIMLSSWLFLADPAFPEITDHEDQFPSLYGEIPLFEIDFEDIEDDIEEVTETVKEQIIYSTSIIH